MLCTHNVQSIDNILIWFLSFYLNIFRSLPIASTGLPLYHYWRASVASETLTGVKMKKSGMFVYWRASVASETLTGVKMKKSGMFVYLYICMDVRKAFLYFDPRVFVLVWLSTPSQIALNRILWFIDQYPYHPRN